MQTCKMFYLILIKSLLELASADCLPTETDWYKISDAYFFKWRNIVYVLPVKLSAKTIRSQKPENF